MSRPLALALVATLLASCKSYPKVDPVYGRQIIPSQRTGSLGGLVQPGGTTPPPQYYEPGAAGQGTQGNSLPAAPAPGGNVAPPDGSFDFRPSSSRVVPDGGASGGGWSRPGAGSGDLGAGGTSAIPARTGPDDFSRRTAPPPDNSGYGTSRYENTGPGSAAPPASAFPPSSPGGDGGAIPVRPNSLPAAPSGADSWNSGAPYRSAAFERAGNSPRGEVVDIMDLPARGSLHPDDAASTGGARPSGYAAFAAPNETADRVPSSGASSSADDQGPYGYDPSYRWLKGHLEYSPTDRRWKLRYIPITGRTDQFGGSVILEDSPALQEMRRGDAVLVEGQIAGDSEPGGFAPLYRAARISRLR
jgi:hypothetical protein